VHRHNDKLTVPRLEHWKSSTKLVGAATVTVGEGIASPAPATKPCVRVSTSHGSSARSSLSMTSFGMSYPSGLVSCTLTPLPCGSAIHRSKACSRRLQRYSSRSLTSYRPHVSISSGFPESLGFLGNPPPRRIRLTPAPWARLRSACFPPPRRSLGG